MPVDPAERAVGHGGEQQAVALREPDVDGDRGIAQWRPSAERGRDVDRDLWPRPGGDLLVEDLSEVPPAVPCRQGDVATDRKRARQRDLVGERVAVDAQAPCSKPTSLRSLSRNWAIWSRNASMLAVVVSTAVTVRPPLFAGRRPPAAAASQASQTITSGARAFV